MSEVKMIDVYGNLPWREDGNVSFLYVEPIQNIMIAKAVNNYDRLQQENAELRESESELVNETEDLKCQIEDLRGVLSVLSDADNHSVSQVRMAMRRARLLMNK